MGRPVTSEDKDGKRKCKQCGKWKVINIYNFKHQPHSLRYMNKCIICTNLNAKKYYNRKRLLDKTNEVSKEDFMNWNEDALYC